MGLPEGYLGEYLVRYDHHLGMALKHVGYLLGVLHQVAVRPLGCVYDHELGFRGDESFQLLNVELPVGLCKRGVLYHRVCVLGPYLIGGISRVRKYYLVPVLKKGKKVHRKGVLSSRRHYDLIGLGGSSRSPIFSAMASRSSGSPGPGSYLT